MPIDNRNVLQNILLHEIVDPETKIVTRERRILTAENADDIQSMFSQERLDEFVKNGVLEGDWKSTQSSGSQASENDDAPTESELGKMNKADLVVAAEKEGVNVVPDSMTNKQIVEAILAKRNEQ